MGNSALVRKIGVVSWKGDIHAVSVCHLSKSRGNPIVHLESDSLFERPSSLRLSGAQLPLASICDSAGRAHLIAEFDVIWWRRPHGPLLASKGEPAVQELIWRSAKAHIEGLFLSNFAGKFVNHPDAAYRAENKIVQLRVANSVGFLTPTTLFSNDPIAVREFFKALDGQVVVKGHFNSSSLRLATKKITSELVRDDASIRIAPSIYQEYVRGDQHFRVVVAGDKYQAMRFINADVDSRLDLSVPAAKFKFDAETSGKLFEFLRRMDLEMGVFDLKMDEHQNLYFLEINQQGQFAYLDLIAGTETLDMVTNFLIECASR